MMADGIRGGRLALILLIGCTGAATVPAAQETAAGFAVVALVDDGELRAELEDGTAAKLEEGDLKALPSHEIVGDVGDVAGRKFLAVLGRRKLAGLLVLRPAPLGPETSLTTVRAAITPQMLRDFGGFAKRVSHIGPEEAPAVVHIAVYLLDGGDPRLLTAGATWLDAEPESRSDAAARLETLVALNIEQAAPAIRQALASRRGR